MDPLSIRIALLQLGYSNRRIANDCGVSDSTVCNVIYGRGASERIARHISDICGIPVRRLWPGRYPRLELRQLPKAA